MSATSGAERSAATISRTGRVGASSRRPAAGAAPYPIAVTAPTRSSSWTRAGSKRTRADSVARLTDASTLSSSLSFRSTRETQPAQVIPSISRVTEEV